MSPDANNTNTNTGDGSGDGDTAPPFTGTGPDADSSASTGGPRHRYAFTTTSWTAVIKAGHAEPEQAREALTQLCQSYWEPLYAYVRRLGKSDNDAKDLTQEFFFLLISKNYLGAVDRKKGKFRSFLLTALKHFLANEWDKSRAAKRGGGQTVLSLDEPLYEGGPLPEPASDITPGKLYEARWAQTVFGQAEARLRATFQASDKEALFNGIKPFLDASTGQGEYPDVAASLGMSQGALRMAVHRARQQFGDLVRDEVARTLIDPTPEEIDEELRHLIETVSR